MRQRPGGVTLIATVFLILALLSLLWSLIVFGFGGLGWLTGWITGMTGMAATGSSNFWAGLLGIVGAAIELVVAFGLYGLKRWAWLLAFVAVGIAFLQGLVGIFSGGFFVFCCGLFGLIIPAAILFYLLRPDVRKAFGQ